MGIVQEVKRYGYAYCRKGGKVNRRQQLKRMMAFAEFCASIGANSLEQVGDRHVIAYWKCLRHLSDATLYNYWRALCLLWKMAGKYKTPPKPKPVARVNMEPVATS